ncbi:hypothetical protein GCM10018793_70930 [Streptomyces sulfonofaciens]|uniref:Uncharacterized protein n=1 Tax=Streptomyces sulfonofaciens TaxID=68272 RepID=A0A919L9V8_9ACTN|nr:hypothetical protein GCM10018793_70930 [Streptomyces sulfonofaciens]
MTLRKGPGWACPSESCANFVVVLNTRTETPLIVADCIRNPSCRAVLRIDDASDRFIGTARAPIPGVFTGQGHSAHARPVRFNYMNAAHGLIPPGKLRLHAPGVNE